MCILEEFLKSSKAIEFLWLEDEMLLDLQKYSLSPLDFKNSCGRQLHASAIG